MIMPQLLLEVGVIAIMFTKAAAVIHMDRPIILIHVPTDIPHLLPQEYVLMLNSTVVNFKNKSLTLVHSALIGRVLSASSTLIKLSLAEHYPCIKLLQRFISI